MHKLGRKLEVWLPTLVGTVYFLSNPRPQYFYDYTFRIAREIIQGRLGLSERPPSWLNEFVPIGGLWYSVFPLGSVISMLPFAALERLGIISGMPSALIYAGLAGATAYFFIRIGQNYDITGERLIYLIAAILFGTFAWTNLTFGGAWQIALGFSMFAQAAAIYFSFFRPRPFLAGCFFALAFGNRTEVLLTAPIYIYFLAVRSNVGESVSKQIFPGVLRRIAVAFRTNIRSLAEFCTVPLILGIATLAYNYLRFESPFDFGYSRIPGVLAEPWYEHGIFSIYYIPRQIWEMLLRPWEFRDSFGLPVPNPFSSSVLISSPFLLFMLRRRSVCGARKISAWLAISVMTTVIWMHGNSGGWQFGYRYWISCLPWAFLILLETSPSKMTGAEKLLFVLSILLNLYATWLFHWTDFLRV